MTPDEANRHALLTPSEMDIADQETIAGGISLIELMDRAGRAVAEIVQAHWSIRPVSVLCGPGNNGGDGFVAARYLQASGWPVRLAYLGSPDRMSPAIAHHAKLFGGIVHPLTPDVLDGAELVIDAIFGSGLSRPISGPAFDMIEHLKKRGIPNCPICAVDLPSGVNGATGEVLGIAASASITVSFCRKKPGHILLPGRSLCGETIVAEIGISDATITRLAPTCFENDPDLWLRSYPWPSLGGHKYQRGEALVLGGERMTGASRLTARAALRAGAGLVCLAVPSPVWSVYAAMTSSVIVQPFDGPEAFEHLLTDKRRTAFAIGPGAGLGATTRRYALAALATGRAVVLDADALTSFADTPDELFNAISGPTILTPHEGEFSRLFDCTGDKLTRARRAAAESGAVIVLKGADTIIAAPNGNAIINSNAPPCLATAGSGDVLAGLITGLLAQGLAPFEAAAAGVWLHGAVGAAIGPGLIADDLPDALPIILRDLKARADQVQGDP